MAAVRYLADDCSKCPHMWYESSRRMYCDRYIDVPVILSSNLYVKCVEHGPSLLMLLTDLDLWAEV